MHIRPHRLTVENFRGLPHLELALPEGVPTYLIGANNSGKSTILHAFALVLGGGGFRQWSPGEFDFFMNAEGERSATFEIRLNFDPNDEGRLPAVQGVGDPLFAYGIVVDGYDERGQPKHRRRLFGQDGNVLTFSPRTPIKNPELRERFRGRDVGWTVQNARLSDIQKHVPEVWLLTPANIGPSLYSWRTGPLQRLSRMLTRRFLEDEWEFTFAEKSREMPRSLHRVHEFFREAVQAFPFWNDELRPRIEEKLSSYLGRYARIELQPQVQALEDWLSQQLAVSFAADAGGALTPLERMGDGWQSLVRLASLDVLRSYPEELGESVVLLYEEPETFLHPHLRRKLRAVLESLAATGWTVVCAIHAPEFVTFREPQQLVRLWREGDSVSAGILETAMIADGPKFQELMDEHGNHEFLFANRAVFCEGKDDVLALEAYLVKAGCDIDGRSVTILNVGGRDNLPHYAVMAARLKIPWAAITDEDKDRTTGEIDPKTVAIREQLQELRGPRDGVPVWPGSLEAALGITQGKASPDWQRRHLLAKSLDEIFAEYGDFAAVGAQVKDWIEASLPTAGAAEQ